MRPSSPKILLLMIMMVLSQAFALVVRPARADGPIYIRADGSIDPPTVPIRRTGSLYTLTSDIVTFDGDAIKIEKDSIILDGADHSFRGDSEDSGNGIVLSGHNITIRNILLNGYGSGIQLGLCSSITISDSHVTNGGIGVNFAWEASNVTIVRNEITGNCYGIGTDVGIARNCTIMGNDISNNEIGIGGGLDGHAFEYNSVVGNNISHNGVAAIMLSAYKSGGSGNLIIGNNITYNEQGISLEACQYSIVSHNIIVGNNNHGIALSGGASNNRISENIITGNGNGILMSSGRLEECAGNSILCNAISYNMIGIELVNSTDNDLFHNNVISNDQQTYIDLSAINSLDDGYPSGGNYWSDYTGIDANSDGIGDTAYLLDPNNRDNYPLMSPWKPADSVQVATFLSIQANASVRASFKADISGALRDEYGQPLRNETVVLTYSFAGNDNWIPITSDTTDQLGRYYVQWFPTATGYFRLKAEWGDNNTHHQVENVTFVSSISFRDKYFMVESDSSTSQISFNETDYSLMFTINGSQGTRGYSRVTVAKELMSDPANIKVSIDGVETIFDISGMTDSWIISLGYTHSIHRIVLDLDTTIIPEFPFFMTSLLFLLTTLVLATLLGRQQRSLYRGPR